MRKIKIICIVLMMAVLSAKAQERSAVYYLCFGSEHYAPLNDSLLQLSEATASAKLMSKILEKYAGAKGKVICSSDTAMFSKQLFKAELDKMLGLILHEGATDPLLVIYYCGHGFTENFVGTQFLLSGDMVKSTTYTDYGEMEDNNVIMKDILLPTMLVTRYLVLLDCCRGHGADASFNMQKATSVWGALTAAHWKNFMDSMIKIVRQMYSNAINASDPFVFADKDLTSVSVAPMPVNRLNLNATTANIGPICRRTILLLEKQLQQDKSLSLQQFVKGITDPTLDTDKTVAVSASGYDPKKSADRPLFKWK